MTACSSADHGTVCTDLFAFVTAVAVDADNQPVSGVAVSDTILRTGEGFAVTQIGYPDAPGTITIFTDSHIAKIRRAGDSVRVIGVGAGKGFSAIYDFGTDGCHVRKLAGPDTVVLR